MKEIYSHEEMIREIGTRGRALVLLYKKGSEQSDCAYGNLREAGEASEGIVLLAADVSQVRDIHTVYGISSAPSVIEFHDGRFRNVFKGCHDVNYFRSVIDEAVYASDPVSGEQTTHRVIVYSTPTCSWCNTLKTHLRMHGIRYSELDVSRDEQALKEMVNKSGQQGVPQTDIDGQMIVGFDKTRINTLLGIQG